MRVKRRIKQLDPLELVQQNLSLQDEHCPVCHHHHRERIHNLLGGELLLPAPTPAGRLDKPHARACYSRPGWGATVMHDRTRTLGAVITPKCLSTTHIIHYTSPLLTPYFTCHGVSSASQRAFGATYPSQLACPRETCPRCGQSERRQS